MRFTSSSLFAAALLATSRVNAQESGVDTAAIASAATSYLGNGDGTGIAASATSALASAAGGGDTAAIASAASSYLGGASGGDGVVSAVESAISGGSVPPGVASFTSAYGADGGALISSLAANPAAAATLVPGLLSSALGNAEISSYIAGNPSLSALVGQATGLIGSSGAQPSNGGSTTDNGSGAEKVMVGLVGMGVAALVGAVAVL
ncbi:hypothetical protein JCM11641_003217 [Rhodosporidiobolus odoratus]